MHWDVVLRARAIENTCYVLGSTQLVPASVGLSVVVDPFGIVLGTCVETEGIVTARITAARVADVRRTLPALEHRRYRATAAVCRLPLVAWRALSPDGAVPRALSGVDRPCWGRGRATAGADAP